MLDLQPISAMYALGSWLGPSDKTRLYANWTNNEYETNIRIEPTEQLVFILLCLFLKCAEFVLETFGATSDEIRLLAFYLNPDFIDVSLKKWVSTNDEIAIITKDLCLNCTYNEQESCLTSTDWNRAITQLSVTKKVWKNYTQSDDNCLLAFDILIICSDCRSKLNLYIILKFGCLHATYSLSVQYMSSKHDTR